MNTNQSKKTKSLDDFWKSVGQEEQSKLSFVINPAFMSAPAWPNLRQSYRVIHTEDSLIIATDGLSDDFQDEEESNNGLGLELFVETKDKNLLKETADTLGKSWLFGLLYQAAQNAVDSGQYIEYYKKYNVFSTEYYNVNVPNNLINENGRVGVLVGLSSKRVPSSIIVDNKEILIICITLITPSDLNTIITDKVNGRRILVEKLYASGKRNISTIIENNVNVTAPNNRIDANISDSNEFNSSQNNNMKDLFSRQSVKSYEYNRVQEFEEKLLNSKKSYPIDSLEFKRAISELINNIITIISTDNELRSYDQISLLSLLNANIDYLDHSQIIKMFYWFEKNTHEVFRWKEMMLNVLVKLIIKGDNLSSFISSNTYPNIFSEVLKDISYISTTFLDKLNKIYHLTLFETLNCIISDSIFPQSSERVYQMIVRSIEQLENKKSIPVEKLNNLKIKFFKNWRFERHLIFETFDRSLVNFPIDKDLSQLLLDRFLMVKRSIFPTGSLLAWLFHKSQNQKSFELFCKDDLTSFFLDDNVIYSFFQSLIDYDHNYAIFLIKNGPKILKHEFMRNDPKYKEVLKKAWKKLSTIQKIKLFIGI